MTARLYKRMNPMFLQESGIFYDYYFMQRHNIQVQEITIPKLQKMHSN